METIGSILKTARESQGKGIDDIVKTTKITRSNITAIESDLFANCPGHAYTRAFIKIYAEELCLDAEELLLMYDKKMSGADGMKPDKGISAGEGWGGAVQNRKFFFVAVAGAICLVILLLVNSGPKVPVVEKERSVNMDRDSGRRPNEKKQKPEQSETTGPPKQKSPAPALTVGKDMVDVAPLKPEVETSQRKEVVAQPPNRSAVQTASVPADMDAGENHSEFMIRFVARDLTWIKILADDEPFEVMLRAGDSYSKGAVRSMHVRIGNSGGVSLFYNDIPLGSPGKPGEPVNILFPEAAENLKRFE